LKRATLIEAILLFAILAVAFYMALWPRLGYPFPLHVDEWMHLGYTTELLSTGHVSYPDPFHGGRGWVGGHPETGYYLWFGSSLLATGAPWLELARLMPALVLGIIVFVAYAWGRKWGFGLEAAFFTTFIHTTIRFLGPAFLVPVTLGLVFFPLCLILLDKLEKGWRPLPLIALSMAALFLIHGTTAVAVGFVLVVYLLFYLTLSKIPRRQLLPAMICLLCVPASALAIYLWNPQFVTKQISAVLSTGHVPLPPIESPLLLLGYIVLAMAVAGFGFMIARGGWRNYALLVPTVILLFFVQFYRQWFEIGPDLLYERGWLYVMLLITFIAGYGLSQLRRLGVAFFKRWQWGELYIYVALALLILFSHTLRMAGYDKENYYRIIDVSTYHDYVWIREELPQSSIALMYPYTAWAFVPITGKYVYTAQAYPWGLEKWEEITKFLTAGGTDTSYLVERNVDLIYSPFPLNNPDLVEVRDDVYILREEVD